MIYFDMPPHNDADCTSTTPHISNKSLVVNSLYTTVLVLEYSAALLEVCLVYGVLSTLKDGCR
jgi:hypothetical protein